MRRNPFEKFLKPEDRLQGQVNSYISFRHPEMRFHHSPNEGKRTPFEQFLIKFLGVKSGFSDLAIFYKGFNLALELKVPPNTPTEKQMDWLHFLRGNGWYCGWADNFEDAIKIIDEFKKWADGQENKISSPKIREGRQKDRQAVPNYRKKGRSEQDFLFE